MWNQNILVVVSETPEFSLDFKLPTTKNIRTRNTKLITSQGIILCASKSIRVVLNWSTNVAFSVLTSVKNKKQY